MDSNLSPATLPPFNADAHSSPPSPEPDQTETDPIDDVFLKWGGLSEEHEIVRGTIHSDDAWGHINEILEGMIDETTTSAVEEDGITFRRFNLYWYLDPICLIQPVDLECIEVTYFEEGDQYWSLGLSWIAARWLKHFHVTYDDLKKEIRPPSKRKVKASKELLDWESDHKSEFGEAALLQFFGESETGNSASKSKVEMSKENNQKTSRKITVEMKSAISAKWLRPEYRKDENVRIQWQHKTFGEFVRACEDLYRVAYEHQGGRSSVGISRNTAGMRPSNMRL